jgi:hypothetical protein
MTTTIVETILTWLVSGFKVSLAYSFFFLLGLSETFLEIVCRLVYVSFLGNAYLKTLIAKVVENVLEFPVSSTIIAICTFLTAYYSYKLKVSNSKKKK